MTSLLLSQEQTVVFDNNTNDPLQPHYVVQIKVTILRYDNGVHYYDIGYKYKFEPAELSPERIERVRTTMHPFHGRCRSDNPNPQRGDIVRKNAMTDAMVTCLLMDDEKLAKVSGLASPQRYRAGIMEMLSVLWD
jgi:hypothetical protein